MGFFNLKDPPPNDAHRRIRDVEGGAPIGYSSVTRGGLRIASEEGLTVEGSILGLANNELGKPAHIEWGGTANFTGDVTATQFEVADGDFRATMNRSGFEVDAVGFDIPTGQSHPFRFHLGSAGVSMEFRNDTAQITPKGLKVSGLPASSSPTSMSVVLVDNQGNFYKGPVYATGGGNPGGGGSTPANGPVMDPFPGRYDAADPFGNIRPSGNAHTGSDWNGIAEGTPCPAMAAGTVTHVGYTSYNGHCITVQMSNGLYYAYLHLMNPGWVSVGQAVTTGMHLGPLGNTGSNSQGAHLHITLSDSPGAHDGLGNKIDPYAWIKANGG